MTGDGNAELHKKFTQMSKNNQVFNRCFVIIIGQARLECIVNVATWYFEKVIARW